MAINKNRDLNTFTVKAVVPAAINEEFTRIAAERNVSKSRVIRTAIVEFMKKHRA